MTRTSNDVSGWVKVILGIAGLILAVGGSWLFLSERVSRNEERICQIRERQVSFIEMFSKIDSKLDEIILKLELHIARREGLEANRRGKDDRGAIALP